MGFDVTSLFAGGIEGIFGSIGNIIAKFKVDPTIAANNAEKLAELQIAFEQAKAQAAITLQQAQLEVDKVEAASTDKFASRWRPAAGWLGVLGLAYGVIIEPLLVWASLNLGWKVPPPLDTNILMTLLFGMLGLGTMRSVEKIQGVSK